MTAYNKYEGKFKKLNNVEHVKKFHQSIKKHFISKYCQDSPLLIDIGSGRGIDSNTWKANNIKFIIGIEPSQDSIRRAISMYKHMHEPKPKIVYINGIGDKLWKTGDAALNPKDKDRFIYFFDNKKVRASNINLCWTIHYMLNTNESFSNLLTNINNHSIPTSILTVLCMDGRKIEKYLQDNNGSYKVMDGETEIFRLDSLYDHTKSFEYYGSKITVTLQGTYGLSKGIEENLVDIDWLIKQFKTIGYEIIENTPFLDIHTDQRDQISEAESKVSELYSGLVFKKI